MHEGAIIATTIFFGLFFFAISLLQFISQKISFPYTVILLLFGFLAQYISGALGIETHISLAPDFIFYILLPLLLFDSAMRINFHQFRLHFKTITFMTTFGLLLSMFIVGAVTAIVAGVPFSTALLFGAIISATDPIAVVAIFKSLRAPKRLVLLAEGESMFNDATAVIVFRALSASVVGASLFSTADVFLNLGNFLYVFIGSMVFGFIAGYVATRLLKKIDNDHVIEATITVSLALSVFIVAEHFLYLSGVIATVLAAVVMGNFGRTAISRGVIHFIDSLWEYIAFIAISLVFFFSTYTLDLMFFFTNPLSLLLVAVGTVVARAVSVYASFAITNTFVLFKREPNVPISWQHVLNWGGLRGVVPLVLVYSMPDSFVYKSELVNFTMAAFLFTLFINGTTIKKLLMGLKIHIPKKEQEIIKEEQKLFEIEENRKRLMDAELRNTPANIKNKIDKTLKIEEGKHKRILIAISTPTEFLRSLRYEALEIERNKLNQLFEEGVINEAVYFSFETQLDLQLDALEFPEVSEGRTVFKGGLVESELSFQKSLEHIETLTDNLPLLSRLTGVSTKKLIKERISFLKARITSSYAVLSHLARLEGIFKKNKSSLEAINQVKTEHQKFIKHNKNRIDELNYRFPKIAREFQEEYLFSIAGIR